MTKIRYASINGLRALSIFLVLLHHLHLFPPSDRIGWSDLTAFLQDGHLGVNVFFVISGFLITSLLLQEEQLTQTISIKNFFIRRTLRIFPAYYFLLLVYFILQLFHVIQISNMSWLTSLTYTKYFNWNLDWYTSHAWSLSVEEHFYLLWPFIFITGPKIRKVLTFLLIIFAIIMRYYFHMHNIYRYDNSLFTRIDAIAIGCLFALYQEKILHLIKPHFKLLFYSSIVGLIFFRIFPFLAKKIYLGFLFIPLGLTHGTLANFMIALIMMYSVFGPQKYWFNFLNSRVLNFIGLLSYSIYLWQQIFVTNLNYHIFKFPFNLFFLFGAAFFSYYFIEKPFLKLKDRFTDGSQ